MVKKVIGTEVSENISGNQMKYEKLIKPTSFSFILLGNGQKGMTQKTDIHKLLNIHCF